MAEQTVDPRSLKLFYHPPGTARLTVGDEISYPAVKVFQAWPLSMPGRHVCFQDAKGEEIAMVESLEELTPESRQVAEEELRRRYLTARVETITEIRSEFGVTYWNVETDRGQRDFVVQSLNESCVWLSERHLLIIDVDGNRFEIPDSTRLDAGSRARLESVL